MSVNLPLDTMSVAEKLEAMETIWASLCSKPTDVVSPDWHEHLLSEFVLTVVDEFDHEITRTRQNAKLMALLDERATQTQTVPLDDVKRPLGLTN